MIETALLPDFITETAEHLEEMETLLLDLEKRPDDQETVNDIFRVVHTIKGGSQFIGLERIAELAHTLENLLDDMRQAGTPFTPAMLSTMIACRDRLAQLLLEVEADQLEVSDISDLLAEIQAFGGSGPGQAPPQEDGLADVMAGGEDGLDLSILEGDDGIALGGEATSDQEVDLLGGLDLSILEGDDGLALGEDKSGREGGGLDELDLSILDGGAGPGGEEGTETEAAAGGDELLASLDLSILDDLEPDTTDAKDEEAELARSLEAALDQEAAAGEAQTLVAPEQEGALAQLSQELAGEDLDVELGQIFHEQASSALAEISNLESQLGQGDPQETLAGCASALTVLRSSANYMDYTALTSFYDEWLAELSGAQEALEQDDEVELAFMGERLQLLTAVLADAPGADEELSAPAPASAGEKGEDGGPEEDGDALIRAELAEGGLDEELSSIFMGQATTHLHTIAGYLRTLAASDDPRQELAAMAETIKSLRSAVAFMDYNLLAALIDEWLQQVEEAGEELPPGDLFDTSLLHSYLGRISSLLALDDFVLPPQGGGEEGPAAKGSDLFTSLSDSVDQGLAQEPPQGSGTFHYLLEEMLTGQETPQGKGAGPAKVAGPATPQAGKGPAAVDRRTLDRRQTERRKPEAQLAKQTVRVDFRKIDDLLNQVGELVVNRAFFSQILSDLHGLQHHLKELGIDKKEQKPVRELSFRLAEATVSLSRISSELQEGVMKVRMLPVAQLFNRYPRLVRDLTLKTGKEVELRIKGEDTELDKMVIEEISDPLIHLIRNSVDHGLEMPEERLALGKPQQGTLLLEAYHEGNYIVIQVIDDGRGVDLEAVKEKAVARGLASSHEVERMSDAEAISFIMLPGFSTASQTTETSGRGVGMDVIKTNIEKLSGVVEVESTPGQQTCVRVKIPLTMAIIPALLVRVGSQAFTTPLSVVGETLKIGAEEIFTVEGVEVVRLRNFTLPVFHLSTLFDMPSQRRAGEKAFVVVVSTGMQRIGLVVDQLLGQEEVVVKPLADYLRHESGFSGATIIGDGRISLILDVYELLKIAIQRQESSTRGKAVSLSLVQTQLAEAEDAE